MRSHWGQTAVSSFASRTSLILAPQLGQRKVVRPLVFSTTSGFVRAWLKVWRGFGRLDTEFSHLTFKKRGDVSDVTRQRKSLTAPKDEAANCGGLVVTS